MTDEEVEEFIKSARLKMVRHEIMSEAEKLIITLLDNGRILYNEEVESFIYFMDIKYEEFKDKQTQKENKEHRGEIISKDSKIIITQDNGEGIHIESMLNGFLKHMNTYNETKEAYNREQRRRKKKVIRQGNPKQVEYKNCSLLSDYEAWRDNMKVIRKGNPKQVECKNCGSLLEYERLDIKQTQVHMNEYKTYIECPECKVQIEVSR